MKTKEEIINEYKRYENNAKEVLTKAKLDEKTGYYKDVKYVKMACGTMYSGLLDFLDNLFEVNNIQIDYGNSKKEKERKQVLYYREGLKKRYNKQLKLFNDCYSVLHLSGYYDGVLASNTIKDGFKMSNEIFKDLSKNL